MSSTQVSSEREWYAPSINARGRGSPDEAASVCRALIRAHCGTLSACVPMGAPPLALARTTLCSPRRPSLRDRDTGRLAYGDVLDVRFGEDVHGRRARRHEAKTESDPELRCAVLTSPAQRTLKYCAAGMRRYPACS